MLKGGWKKEKRWLDRCFYCLEDEKMEGKENWWVIFHLVSQNIISPKWRKKGKNGFEVKKDITDPITPLIQTIIRV